MNLISTYYELDINKVPYEVANANLYPINRIFFVIDHNLLERVLFTNRWLRVGLFQ